MCTSMAIRLQLGRLTVLRVAARLQNIMYYSGAAKLTNMPIRQCNWILERVDSDTGKRYAHLPIFSVVLAKPVLLLAFSGTAQNHFTSIGS